MIIYLLIKYFFLFNIKINLKDINKFKYFFYFIIYTIISLLIISPIFFTNLDSIFLNINKKFLNDLFFINYYKRFIYELIIYFYYILYFTILPIVFFNEDRKLILLKKIIHYIVILFLLIGFIDYYNQFLCRHLHELLFESCYTVGNRFHSFAGEPRQAAVAIVFLLFAINYLKIDKYYILSFFLLIALILTKSFIAYVAIVISSILIIFLILFRNFNYKYLIIFLVFSFFIIYISFTPMFVSNSFQVRVIDYFFAIININLDLDFENLSQTIKAQIGEVYPVWDFINQIKEFKVLSIVFGNGFFSSSVNTYIKYYPSLDVPGNPNSQIIRIVYDFGILGLYLFVYPFIKIMFQSLKKFSYFEMYLFLLILVICLLQRSPLIFIVIGIIMTIQSLYLPEKRKNYKNYRFNKEKNISFK